LFNHKFARGTRIFKRVPGSVFAHSSTDIVDPGLESIQLEKISPRNEQNSAALDPALPHKWPEWNFTGVIWNFFEPAPTR
jgi:hypothetical protein